MPRAFSNVDEIQAFARRLMYFGPDGEAAARRAVKKTARQARDDQRRFVEVLSGETRDSITIDYADDGLSATVGPTNRDDKGRPVGFFLEYGRANAGPEPFVRPAAKRARKNLDVNAAAELRRLIEGR